MGKDCFFVFSKDFLTSVSETLTSWSAASPWIHCGLDQELEHLVAQPLVLLLALGLNCASVGLGWPLAGFGAVFFFSATHAVKSGGSGSGTRPRPVGAGGWRRRGGDLIQWLKSLS